MEEKALGVRNKRVGRKDRHSKICTAKGTRDRRMRLSLNIARKFFDLQDLLGFDKASKTIDWLFSKSNAAIKELVGSSSNCVFPMEDEHKEVGKSKSKRRMSLDKEAREKARSRARERARERMRIKECRNQNGGEYNNISFMPTMEPCRDLMDHRIVVEEFLGLSEENEMDSFGCGGLLEDVVFPQENIGSGYMAISSAFPLWPCYNC